MDKIESLSHSKWECKYHVVFIPKCRRRTLYGQLRQHLGEVFHELARHKDSANGTWVGQAHGEQEDQMSCGHRQSQVQQVMSKS